MHSKNNSLNFYSEYKPLRNFLKQFPIEHSLIHIWFYSQHILYKLPLPRHLQFIINGIPFNLRGSVYPWELMVLLREIILNSDGSHKRRLDNYPDLSKAVNAIKNYDELISAKQLNQESVLKALHRIIHLQFPWQRISSSKTLIRYMKIFGKEDVDEIIFKKTGVDFMGLLLLGLAATGHLRNSPIFNISQSFKDFGVEEEISRAFFEKLTIDVNELRDQYKENQSYDEKWMVVWNPLQLKPLIRLSKSNPDLTYCPIPELLMRRITSGIFFDIVNSDGFSTAYGPAFESYVGEVLQIVFTDDIYSIKKPEPRLRGKKIKHGVDWIVESKTTILLIECKAKRLKILAKVDPDGDVLKEELTTMAGFVIQTYKNLHDISDIDNADLNLKYYPLILTLEEWYLFSPDIVEMLIKEIHSQFDKLGLDKSILDKYPYTILSIDSFEAVANLIARVGINEFFQRKTSEEFNKWDVIGFCNEVYPGWGKQVPKSLFPDDKNLLMEAILQRRMAS